MALRLCYDQITPFQKSSLFHETFLWDQKHWIYKYSPACDLNISAYNPLFAIS